MNKKNEMKLRHPIETGRYLICTKQISETEAIVYNWIDLRIPGAIIYGKPRIGKTSLIKYIRTTIDDELDTPPVHFHMRCKSHQNAKENTFYEDMLVAIDHNFPFEGRPTEKRVRLINYLINIVHQSNQNKIVLFIDDAQRLKKNDYEWLMDIYNELDNEGISMITILVAQEDIIHLINDLRKKQQRQIIGRFMSDDYRYTGFITKEDFKDVLEEYDEYTEFPPGSNISYTEHYFPEQFKKGFRLGNYIDDFMEAFKYIQDEHNIFEFKEIPSLYIIRSIEFVLKTYGENEENIKDLTISHWIEAIENSGYTSANTNLYKNKQITDLFRRD